MKKSELREMIREELEKVKMPDKGDKKWDHIKTGDKTINKKVMKQAKEMFPNTTIKKRHVPAVGYVYYFHDKSGKNIGMVSVMSPWGAVIDKLK